MRISHALVALATIALSIPAEAAPVSGSVQFAARRGPQPNRAEAIVWLEPLDHRPLIQPAREVMTTRSKVLIPHVMAVPAGSTVRFPNEDPITHNLFSLSPSNPFDLGLYRREEGKEQKFEKPGIVTVYCNVHPNMSAVIVVLDTPYWTFVRPDGTWTVDAPPGRYRMKVWHEQAGSSESMISIAPGGVITGSTAVQLQMTKGRGSHLNKHGKPYSRVRDY